MKKIVSIASLLVIILIALLLLFNFSSSSIDNNQQEPRSDTAQEFRSDSPSAEPSRYVDFDSLDTDANDQTHRILFFKADWCITCNGLDKNIEQNADSIPDDVLIVRVDYDHETELKQKYDVRQQHTLVQIDSDGNAVKKWVLSPSLDHILERIERT